MTERPLAVEYVLEVYEPESHDTLVNRFETTTPLTAPRAGETIHPVFWNPGDAPHLALEVVSAGHIIERTSRGTVREQVMVYTKQLDYSKPGTRAPESPPPTR